MAKRDKDRDKDDKAGKRNRALLASLKPLVAPPRLPDATLLDRLYATVLSRKGGDPESSHSARLLSRGTAKVAQKLGEEAVETVIEATRGNRAGLIAESADLLYHLIVVWVDAGVRPEEIWAELERRQGISGIAEKAARARALAQPKLAPRLPKSRKLC